MGPRKMQSVGDRSKAFPNAIRRTFGFVRASLANRARAQINLALPDSPFFSRAKNNHTTRCPSGNQNQLLSLEKVIPHRQKYVALLSGPDKKLNKWVLEVIISFYQSKIFKTFNKVEG